MFSVGIEIKKQVKISLGDDHPKNGKAHIDYVDYGTFIYFPGHILHIAEGLLRPTHYLFTLPHRMPTPLSTIKK